MELRLGRDPDQFHVTVQRYLLSPPDGIPMVSQLVSVILASLMRI